MHDVLKQQTTGEGKDGAEDGKDDGDDDDEMMRVTICSSSLDWYFRWIKTYEKVPPVPYPKKRARLLDHLEHIGLPHISVSGGMDVEIIVDGTPGSQRSSDPRSVRCGLGLMLAGAEFSAMFDVEPSGRVPDPFATGRVLVPRPFRRIWAIQQARSSASGFQSRLFEKRLKGETEPKSGNSRRRQEKGAKPDLGEQLGKENDDASSTEGESDSSDESRFEDVDDEEDKDEEEEEDSEEYEDEEEQTEQFLFALDRFEFQQWSPLYGHSLPPTAPHAKASFWEWGAKGLSSPVASSAPDAPVTSSAFSSAATTNGGSNSTSSASTKKAPNVAVPAESDASGTTSAAVSGAAPPALTPSARKKSTPGESMLSIFGIADTPVNLVDASGGVEVPVLQSPPKLLIVTDAGERSPNGSNATSPNSMAALRSGGSSPVRFVSAMSQPIPGVGDLSLTGVPSPMKAARASAPPEDFEGQPCASSDSGQRSRAPSLSEQAAEEQAPAQEGDEEDAFLYSITVDGMKMLLTLDSRDQLFVITDTLVTTIVSLIPELSMPPAELLQDVPTDSAGEQAEEAIKAKISSPDPVSRKMSLDDWVAGGDAGSGGPGGPGGGSKAGNPFEAHDASSLLTQRRTGRTKIGEVDDAASSLFAHIFENESTVNGALPSTEAGKGDEGAKAVGADVAVGATEESAVHAVEAAVPSLEPAGVGRGATIGGVALHQLFKLRVMSAQMNCQDAETVVGCAVFTMDECVIRADASDIDPNPEKISLQIDIVYAQLFIAPLDIDLGARERNLMWVPLPMRTHAVETNRLHSRSSEGPNSGASTGSGRKSPGKEESEHHAWTTAEKLAQRRRREMFGLLRPIVEPVTLQCAVMVEQQPPLVAAQVDIVLPALRTRMDAHQCLILVGVLASLAEPIDELTSRMNAEQNKELSYQFHHEGEETRDSEVYGRHSEGLETRERRNTFDEGSGGGTAENQVKVQFAKAKQMGWETDGLRWEMKSIRRGLIRSRRYGVDSAHTVVAKLVAEHQHEQQRRQWQREEEDEEKLRITRQENQPAQPLTRQALQDRERQRAAAGVGLQRALHSADGMAGYYRWKADASRYDYDGGANASTHSGWEQQQLNEMNTRQREQDHRDTVYHDYRKQQRDTVSFSLERRYSHKWGARGVGESSTIMMLELQKQLRRKEVLRHRASEKTRMLVKEGKKKKSLQVSPDFEIGCSVGLIHILLLGAKGGSGGGAGSGIAPFVEVTLRRGISVSATGYHDFSGKLSVDIAHLFVKNTTASATGPWANLLLPHTRDPQESMNTTRAGRRKAKKEAVESGSKYWEPDSGVPMVRLHAEMGKPVGGIAVVRHFELGVCPLQIFLTYEVVKAFIDFGAPFQKLAADAKARAKEGPAHLSKKEAKLRGAFMSGKGASGAVGIAKKGTNKDKTEKKSKEKKKDKKSKKRSDGDLKGGKKKSQNPLRKLKKALKLAKDTKGPSSAALSSSSSASTRSSPVQSTRSRLGQQDRQHLKYPHSSTKQQNHTSIQEASPTALRQKQRLLSKQQRHLRKQLRELSTEQQQLEQQQFRRHYQQWQQQRDEDMTDSAGYAGRLFARYGYEGGTTYNDSAAGAAARAMRIDSHSSYDGDGSVDMELRVYESYERHSHDGDRDDEGCALEYSFACVCASDLLLLLSLFALPPPGVAAILPFYLTPRSSSSCLL
jgi:hypothetical protein